MQETNENTMTADQSPPLERRLETGTASYQKPFVMEYLPNLPYPDGRSPFHDVSIWPIGMQVYVGDVCIPHGEHKFLYPTDYECFSPTLMRYAAEELLGGCKRVEFKFGPGSAEFIFTKTENGYSVSVKKGYLDKSDFDPTTLPPVIVPGEVAAYQFAKALSEHYKDMARFGEIKLLCYERFSLESVFSDPKITRLANADDVELYNFEGVPERKEIENVTVSQEDLERVIKSLEEELQEHIKIKLRKNGKPDCYEYGYLLKDGNRVTLTVRTISETETEIKIEMPGEREEDEYIFDIVANKWEKKERLGWASR